MSIEMTIIVTCMVVVYTAILMTIGITCLIHTTDKTQTDIAKLRKEMKEGFEELWHK